MAKYCLRPLSNNILTEVFAEDVLEVSNRQLRSACNLIVSAEDEWRKFADRSTLKHMDFRDHDYRNEEVRNQLRLKIVKELVTKTRLPDDDKIKLGKGGILPNEVIAAKKKAYYVIGLPASGKSTIACKIADFSHSAILDNDYAKRKLPEFKQHCCGATLVHDEADQIVFSNSEYSAIEYCVGNGYNIVIPKIGGNLNGVITLTDSLKNKGYDVFLVLIDLDRKAATQRAFMRFKTTKRYVPLTLIFDQSC